ncbi:hypothetical protein Tco_1081339 [Tanacetum coccineum]|uniref:Uncharacterized protein n=1 Tax=Tanacetum coccineum TaxID=301880 RepID=A0ABQ5HY65_9ASTR
MELRVCERDNNNKCVSVFDESCKEKVQDSSEIQEEKVYEDEEATVTGEQIYLGRLIHGDDDMKVNIGENVVLEFMVMEIDKFEGCVNRDEMDTSKPYENNSVNKLEKVEEESNGKQDGSKDYNKLVGSHFMLGKNKEGSWWLYHIKDPCDALAYGAMNLGTSICIKPQTCWCAACIQKGNKCLVIINEPRVSKECGKVKTTPPLKFDKKLAGFDEMQEPVVMKTGNTGDVELLDQCTVECLGGIERETCDKMRNSVKKDGSRVHEIEFIGGDIIREEKFNENRKNGNNSFSNIVGKKKEYCVEQNEGTKENDNFVVWEEILVKSEWKKLVFEESGNGYGTYSNSSKAQLVVREGRGGVKLNMWRWTRRKKARVMFDIWKWPKRKYKYVLFDIWGVWTCHVLRREVTLKVGNSFINRFERNIDKSGWKLLVLDMEDETEFHAYKRCSKVEMAIPVQNINHSAFRSMFEISGNNFNDWFRQLKMVLRVERKLFVIEQPISLASPTDSEYLRSGMRYMIHNEELKSMFEKQAGVEWFDLIQTFHACKQDEGKPVGPYVIR